MSRSVFESYPVFSVISSFLCDRSFAFHMCLVVLFPVHPGPSVVVDPEAGIDFVDSSEDVAEVDTHVERYVYPHCCVTTSKRHPGAFSGCSGKEYCRSGGLCEHPQPHRSHGRGMAGWCPQQGQLAGTSSLPALPVKGQGHGQSARGPSGAPLACGGGAGHRARR